MKHFFRSNIRAIFAFAMFWLYASTMNAQSTVYVFMRPVDIYGKGGGVTMTINGDAAVDMRGPFKKALPNMSNPSMPLFRYKGAIRKCTFNEEGKVLLAMDYGFVNVKGATSHLTGEMQLQLTEGSVHYVKVEAKGLNDLQFKELKEKEGMKLLKDKKYEALPDYTYNSSANN